MMNTDAAQNLASLGCHSFIRLTWTEELQLRGDRVIQNNNDVLAKCFCIYCTII